MNIIDNFLHKSNLYLRDSRAWLFKPLLKLLTLLNINAYHLTNFRFILSILFIPLFSYSPIYSVYLIFFIYVLDTLDGAIARYQNKCSDRGKFLDLFIDLILTLLPIYTFLFYNVEMILVVTYMSLIPFVYLLAIIWKNEFEKSDWLIKPYPQSGYLRILPLFAFWIFHLFNIDLLRISLMISNVLLIIFFLYYYVAIQLRWEKMYK